jgi:hypothetical protein
MRILEDASDGYLPMSRINVFYKLCSIVGSCKFTDHSIKLIKEYVELPDIDDDDLKLMEMVERRCRPSLLLPSMIKVKNVLELTKLGCLTQMYDKLYEGLLEEFSCEKKDFLVNMRSYNKIEDKQRFLKMFEIYIASRFDNGCYYGIERELAFARELDIWCGLNIKNLAESHGIQNYYGSLAIEEGIAHAVYIRGCIPTRFETLFNAL